MRELETGTQEREETRGPVESPRDCESTGEHPEQKERQPSEDQLGREVSDAGRSIIVSCPDSPVEIAAAMPKEADETTTTTTRPERITVACAASHRVRDRVPVSLIFETLRTLLMSEEPYRLSEVANRDDGEIQLDHGAESVPDGAVAGSERLRHGRVIFQGVDCLLRQGSHHHLEHHGPSEPAEH